MEVTRGIFQQKHSIDRAQLPTYSSLHQQLWLGKLKNIPFIEKGLTCLSLTLLQKLCRGTYKKEEKPVWQDMNQLAILVFSLSNSSYSYPFWQILSMP